MDYESAVTAEQVKKKQKTVTVAEKKSINAANFIGIQYKITKPNKRSTYLKIVNV